MDETLKITLEQWESWRQHLLSKRQEGQLALVIYDPQSNRITHMSIPPNFFEMTDTIKAEAYLLPAIKQLDF